MFNTEDTIAYLLLSNQGLNSEIDIYKVQDILEGLGLRYDMNNDIFTSNNGTTLHLEEAVNFLNEKCGFSVINETDSGDGQAVINGMGIQKRIIKNDILGTMIFGTDDIGETSAILPYQTISNDVNFAAVIENSDTWIGCIILNNIKEKITLNAMQSRILFCIGFIMMTGTIVTFLIIENELIFFIGIPCSIVMIVFSVIFSKE